MQTSRSQEGSACAEESNINKTFDCTRNYCSNILVGLVLLSVHSIERIRTEDSRIHARNSQTLDSPPMAPCCGCCACLVRCLVRSVVRAFSSTRCTRARYSLHPPSYASYPGLTCSLRLCTLHSLHNWLGLVLD